MSVNEKTKQFCNLIESQVKLRHGAQRRGGGRRGKCLTGEGKKRRTIEYFLVWIFVTRAWEFSSFILQLCVRNLGRLFISEDTDRHFGDATARSCCRSFNNRDKIDSSRQFAKSIANRAIFDHKTKIQKTTEEKKKEETGWDAKKKLTFYQLVIPSRSRTCLWLENLRITGLVRLTAEKASHHAPAAGGGRNFIIRNFL